MIHPSIHSDTLFEILREEMGLRICCCVDSPTSPDAARNAGCCLFPRGLILNLLLIGYYTSPKKSNWSIPYHSLPFERNTWEQWRALTKTLQVSIIYVLQQFNLLNNSENYMPFHFHWIIIISHHFPSFCYLPMNFAINWESQKMPIFRPQFQVWPPRYDAWMVLVFQPLSARVYVNLL